MDCLKYLPGSLPERLTVSSLVACHLMYGVVDVGISKGTTLTTKKSLECKAIIKKHSKDFGGSLNDPDVIKLCGCSRNSYYKYKREIKNATR